MILMNRIIKNTIIISLLIPLVLLGIITDRQSKEIEVMKEDIQKQINYIHDLEMSNISYEQYIQKKVIDNELIEIIEIERE